MTTGNRLTRAIAAGFLLLAAACSDDEPGIIGLNSVVQNLTLDPDGRTTVLVTSANPSAVGTGNLQASGGQTALLVTQAGSTLTVVWDQRVTPSHLLRLVGVPDVTTAWYGVGTTDGSQPTFATGVATQDTSDALLGGDQVLVTFSGPRVVPSSAEDVSNWTATTDGATLDLTGSTFVLDVPTQVLTMTFGAGANLHATFTLAATGVISVADVALDASPQAGTAAGDAVAPSLASVEQILGADEFGRIVDFVFDEPMDPIFSTSLGGFTVVDGPGAVGITLTTDVTMPNDVTLRVTFSKPVVPGFDTVTHSGLMDAHGNVLTAGTVAVGNAGSLPNGFDTVTATTVENQGGDTITIVTDQAFDPDFATDPTLWSIDVATVPVVMANQTLVYDMTTKELTVTLDFDMRNGDAVDVTAVAVPEVDGQSFSSAAASVMAAGDANPPGVLAVMQNRSIEPGGTTLDVTFDEDVHPVNSTNSANYTFVPAVTIDTATLLAGGNIVRLETQSVLTPGDFTITIDGSIDDVAGVPMGANAGPLALTSSDITSPAPLVASGNAVEGADDDTVVVIFDDDLVPAEIENAANWAFESPVGTVFPLTSPTIAWNGSGRVAVLTLDEGLQALKGGDDLQVSFVNVRDIGGNLIDPSPIVGTISAETVLPSVHTVWRRDVPNDGTVTVRFSEPCDRLDDLYDALANQFGTRYALRMNDPSQTLRGYPTTATILDGGLGVELNYLFTVDLADTLDVIGPTDLAGNVMFPAMDLPVQAEDATAPDHVGPPALTAVAGESNDDFVVDFNVAMSPWRIENPVNYALVTNPGGVAIDLLGTVIQWDGGTTVTFDLAGLGADNLDASEMYDVTLVLDMANPLRSAQGVPLALASTLNVPVMGDTTNGPTQAGSSARMSSLVDDQIVYFVFDEAVSQAAVEASVANWVYDGSTNPLTVALVSPRVARLDFGTPITPSFIVRVLQVATDDLAGNPAAGFIDLAVQDDTTGPLLAGVLGTIVPGAGGDRVDVGFNEQIDLATGLAAVNYTVINGTAVDLAGASLTFDSTTTTVSINLPAGTELDAAAGLTIQVANVQDAAGNPMAGTASLGGLLSGDSTAPDFASAWTNYQEDATGRTIDVLFSEDVDTTYLAVGQGNWSTSGPSAVNAVEVIGADHVRLTLAASLAPAETIDLAAGLEDLALNAAPALSVDPVDPED